MVGKRELRLSDINMNLLLALEAPIDLPPFGIDLAWHERFDRDPGHRWLREQVAAVLQGFTRASG